MVLPYGTQIRSLMLKFLVFQIAYHNALKRIVGVPVFYSSHGVAEYCNLFLFQHYIISLQCRYFKRIMNSNNILIKLCLPFLTSGRNMCGLRNILRDKYSVDFQSNEYEIIRSRISRVQKDEIPAGLQFSI